MTKRSLCSFMLRSYCVVVFTLGAPSWAPASYIMPSNVFSKTVSVKPFQQQLSVNPTDEEALTVLKQLKESNNIREFKYLQPCFECRTKTVSIKDLLKNAVEIKLNPDRQKKILELLSEPNTYIVGLTKPCYSPSPKAALLINMKAGDLLILIFPDCGQLLLQFGDGDLYKIINVADSTFPQLTKLLQLM